MAEIMGAMALHPDEQQLAEAARGVNEIYASDFAAADTSAKQQALARTLILQGSKVDDNPAARYVMFDSAIRLAFTQADLSC